MFETFDSQIGIKKFQNQFSSSKTKFSRLKSSLSKLLQACKPYVYKMYYLDVILQIKNFKPVFLTPRKNVQNF